MCHNLRKVSHTCQVTYSSDLFQDYNNNSHQRTISVTDQDAHRHDQWQNPCVRTYRTPSVRLWIKEQSYEKRGTKTNTRGSQRLVSKRVKDYSSKIMYFSLTRQAQLHLNHIGNVYSLQYSDMQDSNMLHIDTKTGCPLVAVCCIRKRTVFVGMYFACECFLSF
jgi:hypothetical protein